MAVALKDAIITDPVEPPVGNDEPIVEPVVDEPTEPDPEPQPVVKKKTDPVVADLIEQRARRREAEEKAAKAERRAAEAEALAARLAKGEAGDAPKQPSPQGDDAEIDRRAEHKLFLRDVNVLRERGMSKFGAEDFNQAIQNLAAYGADNDEFVRAVMDVDRDNAHELLHEISQDGPRALGLSKMSPNQRIAELTKMSIARQNKTTETVVTAKDEPKPVGKSISAAPKPAPAISSSTTQQLPMFSDKKGEKDFDKDFDEWAKNRGSKR